MANEREKIAREIERTSESIRRKHRALKTGRIDEDRALDRRFGPIVEPLRRIAGPVVRATKTESYAATPKRKREEEEEEEEDFFVTPRTRFFDRTPITSTPHAPTQPSESIDSETTTYATLAIPDQNHSSENREKSRINMGPLSLRYVEPVLRGLNDSGMDRVYGAYLDKDGLMLGSKRFDVDNEDNIIIDGVRHAGTPGLYELIFKRIPDDTLQTEQDMREYKSLLQATNAHRHKHHPLGRVLANRGYKYKNVIKPLVTPKKKSGKGVPRAMTLNDGAIEYVHWDDPNELVERLRLLDASHRAGNAAHGNEMLSIIEELRGAGVIIN
ncbi:hypothetical protein ALC62_12068 [Cyphomyrmex costatus]|uniref:DUF8207 domain-containing protein n=1 Tax=Cyphomyrmex costatus TaxID=456900 RepID=A0A151IC01_9HYME|nr:hypothetical protein ALC62_12068 [Cyphomyrmex costatus]